MKDRQEKMESKVKINISLTGDYDLLSKKIIDLQRQGISIQSLETMEGWLSHSIKMSGIEEDAGSDFLTQCLSDPEFVQLSQRLFAYLQKQKMFYDGIMPQIENENSRKVKHGTEVEMDDAEEMMDYLEGLYEKMC